MSTIEVTGMGCDGCEDIIENALGEVHGVQDIEADHESGIVEYEGDPDLDAVAEAVDFAGYEVTEAETTEE